MIIIFLTEKYDAKALKKVLEHIDNRSSRGLSYLMGKGEADVCIEKGVFSNIEDVKIDSEFIDEGKLCILINRHGLECSYYRGISCNIGSFVKERL
ncbi:TreD [Staphylococcus phage P4W]|uniref:TreD n=1 Tax=Staphylococcus phage P4W TaxID=1195080 RepID=I6X685_9CAUD|nr:TreD [Staphylococcus phage P4W]YP_009781831.1 TreD [Staphylococcus phage P4W]AFN38862.1 TreD [Staphylococcus phage P4W]AHL83305.1 TreD [Staphylococcus phage P4W]